MAYLAWGCAVLGRDLLWKFRPPQIFGIDIDLALDAHVLLFTFLIAIGTGLIFGLAPAMQASRPDLVSELKERSGGDLHTGSRFKLRDVLVTLQVAICLVALIGAGLFVISLRNAQKMDAGFDTQNLAMLNFDTGSLNYDAVRSREFQRRTLEAVENLPGVKAVTLGNVVPLFNGGFGRTCFREGEDTTNGQNGKFVQMGAVAQNYLQTMGIPMVRGSGFDTSVREDSPRVAIINETAAKTLWPMRMPSASASSSSVTRSGRRSSASRTIPNTTRWVKILFLICMFRYPESQHRGDVAVPHQRRSQSVAEHRAFTGAAA